MLLLFVFSGQCGESVIKELSRTKKSFIELTLIFVQSLGVVFCFMFQDPSSIVNFVDWLSPG